MGVCQHRDEIVPEILLHFVFSLKKTICVPIRKPKISFDWVEPYEITEMQSFVAYKTAIAYFYTIQFCFHGYKVYSPLGMVQFTQPITYYWEFI